MNPALAQALAQTIDVDRKRQRRGHVPVRPRQRSMRGVVGWSLVAVGLRLALPRHSPARHSPPRRSPSPAAP
jgi:hypothetical protein